MSPFGRVYRFERQIRQVGAGRRRRGGGRRGGEGEGRCTGEGERDESGAGKRSFHGHGGPRYKRDRQPGHVPW